MAETTTNEAYDLLILVDATSSMSGFLTSLTQSLPQIISISALTNCFERIGLLAYRDYCDHDLLEWSGWMTPGQDGGPDLVTKASKLIAIGGGDYPEATKTGLAQAYNVMRKEATTVILLYTDSPPHMIRALDSGYHNDVDEQEALREPTSYGGYGPLFADWVSAANTLRHGEKRARVFSILNATTKVQYTFLSTVTEGAIVTLQDCAPRVISEVTVAVLLTWMGVRKEGSDSAAFPAKLHDPLTAEDVLSAASESDPAAFNYLNGVPRPEHHCEGCKISTEVLERHLLKKATPLQDLAKSYKADARYRDLVTKELRNLIKDDIVTISLNPVFGSLWRAFCNDRENEHRQELLDAFGKSVDGIKNDQQRALMKAWLEKSYDYTAEVAEAIATVPEAERFPCVCLDPTLAFTQVSTTDADDAAIDDDRPITSFRRDELLEIGRSCDWRILRRLGRIMTRLTFVESAVAMPSHIAAASESDVPRIPLALASKQYGRRFWRLLLHIVVPGTMLGRRAAALLAALSIRLGVQPLMKPAVDEMLFWRNTWNDIEIPETWNVSCLSLLLDADKTHRGGAERAPSSENQEMGLVMDEDRRLFERLLDYKLLESNLNTTLTARVGWTPQRATMPIGPVVVCISCKLPRSVTIMGTGGICGLCCCELDDPEEERTVKNRPVSEHDTAGTDAVWYECSMQHCRAQYVVYNVEQLNVRPKCHYCRTQGNQLADDMGLEADIAGNSPAPVITCGKCLSRMVWPREYRTGLNCDPSSWTCVACDAGRNTIVDLETTAQKLRAENGDGWLLENAEQKTKQPFGNRSLYKIAAEAVPLENFCERVTILPAWSEDTSMQDADDHHSTAQDRAPLVFHGKLIHNTPALLDQLDSWVVRRRTEAGTCSLCFSDLRKDGLLPACGRRGCFQRVCKDCLQSWYGLNAPGRIINTAALSCAFCRRAPTAKTLAHYGMGVHAVGGLKEAVEQRGEWVYAWCAECGFAKQYVERVCAGGAPAELSGWSCEACQKPTAGEQRKTRPCPGCGVETEKSDGCDHMCCSVPGCGVHWCFYCGKAEEEGTIYDHMQSEHGGYYGDEGMDDEE